MNRREFLKVHLVKTIKVVKTNLKTGEELAVDAEILSTELFLILRIGGRIVTDVSGPWVFSEILKYTRHSGLPYF